MDTKVITIRNDHRETNYVKVIVTYHCAICNSVFSNKASFTRHKADHTDHKPFACSICGYRSSLKVIVTNHMKLQHAFSTKEPEVLTEEDGMTVVEYKCMICKEQYRTEDEFHEHHLGIDKCQLRFCMKCDKSNAGANTGKRKIRSYSAGIVRKPSNETRTRVNADIVASDGSVQIAPKRNFDGMAVYKCLVCNRRSKTPNLDCKHNQGEKLDAKPYGCHLCDYRCGLRGIMKNHLQIKHNINIKVGNIAPQRPKIFAKTYQCPKCDKGYQSARRLAEHIADKGACREYKINKTARERCLKRKLQRMEEMGMNTFGGAETYGAGDIKIEIGETEISSEIDVKPDTSDFDVVDDPLQDDPKAQDDNWMDNVKIEKDLMGDCDVKIDEIKLIHNYVKTEAITPPPIDFYEDIKIDDVDKLEKELLEEFVKEEPIDDSPTELIQQHPIAFECYDDNICIKEEDEEEFIDYVALNGMQCYNGDIQMKFETDDEGLQAGYIPT